jgi:CRISPR/Cas system CSM-associated protein Csm3 (group 7 of RAMP superfamily)
VNTLERVSGEAKMLRLTKYLTKKSIFKTEMIFTIFVSKEIELTSISKRAIRVNSDINKYKKISL